MGNTQINYGAQQLRGQPGGLVGVGGGQQLVRSERLEQLGVAEQCLDMATDYAKSPARAMPVPKAVATARRHWSPLAWPYVSL